jgi:hypothetical protein
LASAASLAKGASRSAPLPATIASRKSIPPTWSTHTHTQKEKQEAAARWWLASRLCRSRLILRQAADRVCCAPRTPPKREAAAAILCRNLQLIFNASEDVAHAEGLIHSSRPQAGGGALTHTNARYLALLLLLLLPLLLLWLWLFSFARYLAKRVGAALAATWTQNAPSKLHSHTLARRHKSMARRRRRFLAWRLSDGRVRSSVCANSSRHWHASSCEPGGRPARSPRLITTAGRRRPADPTDCTFPQIQGKRVDDDNARL